MVRADAAQLLSALPSGCVEAVVTDPPWNLGRPYGANSDRMADDDYVRWLGGVLRSAPASAGARSWPASARTTRNASTGSWTGPVYA